MNNISNTLNNISNTALNDNVSLPNFPRERLTSRIVHIGFGAFHRAHQSLFTHELAEATDSNWGICEVNLFGGEELITKLRDQDHLYTVLERGRNTANAKVIASITESLHVTFDGVDAILNKLASPVTEIVSLTVTEKGYCVDAATGNLDLSNTLIVNDLKNPSVPSSAIGFIVEALRMRRDSGLPSFTVMSCDNIQENGHVAKKAITQFAKTVDETLAQWIETHTKFPCTMVDRIVPAATDETLAQIQEHIGVYDPVGIACEEFKQWVIEDDFVQGRPDWDNVGAQFVKDVVPYEEMKLRMLNGTHSFLAYLGYLAGYMHISDAMENSSFRSVAHSMMVDVQAKSLSNLGDVNLSDYADQLIERFINPSLKHRTWQIAMDGSQKIPQRLVGSLRYHLAQGNDISILATAIAGWIKYSTGIDEGGNPIEVLDPLKDQLSSLYTEYGTGPEIVKVVLGISSIFPEDIGKNERVITAVTIAYTNLLEFGSRKTVTLLGELL